MLNLLVIMSLKRMYLTHHFTSFGVQMTVVKCGNQKEIAREEQEVHMSHNAAHQTMDKDQQSYSMPKIDIAVLMEELFSIQLLVNNCHMLLEIRICQKGFLTVKANNLTTPFFLLYIFF